MIACITNVGSAEINLAEGKTVTITGFSVPPSSTQNIIDNDFNTVSGYGIPAPGGNNFMIDLGDIFNLSSIRYKMGSYDTSFLWSGSVYLYVSSDEINWIELHSYTTNSTEVTVNETFTSSVSAVRYLKAYVTSSASSETYVRWYEIQALAPETTTLINPANNSYDYFTYPDFIHDVYFSWTNVFYNYNIKIAKDSSFILLTVDKTISTNYTTESLEPATYYWKVRTYNSTAGTYGDYSNTSIFYLIRNTTSTGVTGIEGSVYELIAGTPTPLSEVTVYIRKEALNWSDSMITSSTGYYLFDNLTNSTVYSISAKATGYEDSVTEYVTTIPGQRATKNILLNKCISGFNCFYNQQYVKFTVQNIWFTKYPGVTATVYKGSELVASDTQTGGTDGSVNFLLIKDQQYRITFVNTTQGISVTWTGYPSETEYYIITDATTSGWDTHGTDAATTTDIEVTTATINDTHAYVNMSYNDTLAGTSNLIFYLNKSIAGDPNNQTNLQSIDGGDADQYNASFIVSGYGGNSYIIRVKADHSTYGTISYSYGVQFAQLLGPMANFDPTIILMLFVAFVLFISGVFGQTTNAMGSGIICGLVWILAGIGVFSAANVGINFYLALTLATVIVIIMNINERGRSEALQ